MQNCSIPAARASSTAYWISGLSTTGSISLGIAFVAGRKRVPSPATGSTALRNGFTKKQSPYSQKSADHWHGHHASASSRTARDILFTKQ
jgi:hypothetical protein